jgi:hypothetical protein
MQQLPRGPIDVNTGKEFEERVEQLLRLTGYSVKRNVLIGDTQIDLVATYPGGFAKIRYLVECTNQTKSVPIDYVKEKAAILLATETADEITCLMVVSRKEFTAQARAFADHQPRVILRTEADLERGLVNFAPYRDWYIANYEHSTGMFADASLHEHYLDNTAYDSHGNVHLINGAADAWLRDSQNNVLFVLGDYGAGKTSFLRQLAYRLLTNADRHDDGSNPIPILIPLREYRSAISLRQVITDALLNEYGVQLASFHAFERFCSLGHVVLLLDGFDEMAARSDEKTIADCLGQIYILAETNTKLIVTCRSNFFRSHQQVIDSLQRYAIDVTGFRPKGRSSLPLGRHGTILTLQSLTDKEIRQFITLRFPDDVDDLLATMASIHDLTDLCHRPVLLDMILKTLPDLKRSGDVANSAALYEHYTNRWTLRDAWRIQMPIEIRQAFCDALAWTFMARGEMEISYSRLRTLLEAVLRGLADSHEQLEEYVNDIQTCSFIVRTGEGDLYQFAHKSFMEYFVGRRLAKVLAGDDTPDVAKAVVSAEEPFAPVEYLPKMPVPRVVDLAFVRTVFNHRLQRAGAFAVPSDTWWQHERTFASSSASLSAHIEQRVLAMYDVRSDLPFGVSPEVATFAVEWLETQGTRLRELVRSCRSRADEQRLADVIRHAVATRYFASQAATLNGIMRENSNPLLRAAAAGALAQSGQLNTPELLLDARKHLGEKGFAYLLYVIAEGDDDKTLAAVDSLCTSGDVDAFGAVIAGLGHRSRMGAAEFSLFMIERVRDFAASGADPQLALLLTEVITPDDAGLLEIAEAVIRSTAPQKAKLDVVRLLDRIEGSDLAARRLKRLWVQTRDQRVRAALDRQRSRVLSVAATRRDRASWSPAISPAARDRLWASLRT